MSDFRSSRVPAAPLKAGATGAKRGLLAGHDRRRGVRVNSQVPVVLEWDSGGELLRGEAQTRVVGPYGCMVVLSKNLDVEQRIQLTNLVSRQSNPGVVVWRGKQRSEGWELGIELINPEMNFWGLDSVTSNKGQADRGPSLMAGEERRRSQRVIIRIPVTLDVTMSGGHIMVQADTVAVNIHGAMVLCPRSLDEDTKLEIVNGRTNERASARVTRASRESAEGYLIPIEFSAPSPTFWQISFPPASWKPSDAQ